MTNIKPVIVPVSPGDLTPDVNLASADVRSDVTTKRSRILDHVETTGFRQVPSDWNFWIKILRSENRDIPVFEWGRGGRCTQFEVSRVVCSEWQGERDCSQL
jgi:hypothetical protein